MRHFILISYIRDGKTNPICVDLDHKDGLAPVPKRTQFLGRKLGSVMKKVVARIIAVEDKKI